MLEFCFLEGEEEENNTTKPEGEIGAKMKEERNKKKRGSKGRGGREVCNNFL